MSYIHHTVPAFDPDVKLELARLLYAAPDIEFTTRFSATFALTRRLDKFERLEADRALRQIETIGEEVFRGSFDDDDQLTISELQLDSVDTALDRWANHLADIQRLGKTRRDIYADAKHNAEAAINAALPPKN